MESDTPSPQDPARSSKPKSEPPILDLEAEKPAAEKADTAAKQTAPKHDTLRVEKKATRRLPIDGVIGGMLGGGLVALGVLAYAQFFNSATPRLTALEHAVTQKLGSDALASLEERVTQIETALTDAKAAIATAAKTVTPPDPELVKRIATLEDAIRHVSTNGSQTIIGQDRHALRLALVLSLRDAIRNDQYPAKELAALESLGEASASFATLKANLSSPLVSYDEIRAEMALIIKNGSATQAPTSDAPQNTSRVSSFFSQLVTVRPASPVVEKSLPTDMSQAALLDAVDQNDAKAALTTIAALPQAERAKWQPIESELKRHLNCETAIARLLDEMLDAATKGDTP